MWISEDNLSVLFYATPFLAQKSVLIELCWYCYQLAGLISSFFRSLVKITWSLSHFVIFIANKKEGASQLFIRILPKKKKWTIKHPDVQVRSTIMLCLYYYVFLISSYIFKIFLLAMFGKLTIVLLDSSLWFETEVKQFETS